MKWHFAAIWETVADTGKVLYISPAYETVWGRSCQSMYENARSFLEGVVAEDLEGSEGEAVSLAAARAGTSETWQR